MFSIHSVQSRLGHHARWGQVRQICHSFNDLMSSLLVPNVFLLTPKYNKQILSYLIFGRVCDTKFIKINYRPNIRLCNLLLTSTCSAFGPDTLMTDIPARPGAEDNAKIVLLDPDAGLVYFRHAVNTVRKD